VWAPGLHYQGDSLRDQSGDGHCLRRGFPRFPLEERMVPGTKMDQASLETRLFSYLLT
jgi:hypothetical protein